MRRSCSGQRRARRPRTSPSIVSSAALVISVIALVLSASGFVGARGAGSPRRRAGAPTGQVVRLDNRGQIPARLLPTVPRAVSAEKVGQLTAAALTPSCPGKTADLGTWCMMRLPYTVPLTQLGNNNYFYASQACVTLGGYLPTAAQLIGAAGSVPLESVIIDNPGTSTIETDPTLGLHDQREMSATLVTVSAGSDAAGSEGVSVGATGNPNTGQPDPTPTPANPRPETLQYVTVYGNGQKGGFAGSEPVATPENFRCAFNKVPGGSSHAIQ